jgi:hypothetical protein
MKPSKACSKPGTFEMVQIYQPGFNMASLQESTLEVSFVNYYIPTNSLLLYEKIFRWKLFQGTRRLYGSADRFELNPYNQYWNIVRDLILIDTGLPFTIQSLLESNHLVNTNSLVLKITIYALASFDVVDDLRELKAGEVNESGNKLYRYITVPIFIPYPSRFPLNYLTTLPKNQTLWDYYMEKLLMLQLNGHTGVNVATSRLEYILQEALQSYVAKTMIEDNHYREHYKYDALERINWDSGVQVTLSLLQGKGEGNELQAWIEKQYTLSHK